ncbi:MAG TPA: amino acid ABC transporter permease [Actinomycetota bacterium]|jgi:polar amino acid transport system permease protein
MATDLATTPIDSARPPDVRGPTAPLPAGIFVVGVVSLVLVLAGTIGIQLWYAANGGGLTQTCIAGGLQPYHPNNISNPGVNGAEGICHIYTAATSSAQSVVLWGSVLLGLAAAVAGFAVYRRMDTRRKRSHAFAGAVLGVQAVLIAAFLLWFRSGRLLVFARNEMDFVWMNGNWGAFVSGIKNTLILALLGEAGGIILGLILSLFTMAEHKVVRAPARVYINFFRGTPLIWQLSFFWFGLILVLQVPLSTFQTAILVFSLNMGAYSAEVFRAGIQSIERGQMEAARGLGFSYLQAMRYAIIPQAVRRVIPPLLNEFVILIKDTSLILILGLSASQYDLFTWAQSGYSATFSATFFVMAAVGYLVITLPLIRLVNAVERRLRSGLVGIAGGGA